MPAEPPRAPAGAPAQSAPGEPLLSRVAARLVALAERYLPDAFLFALGATALVLCAGLFVASPGRVLDAWGKGFFSPSLLSFTVQMALVIISGHVVASAPGVRRLLQALAQVPRTGRGAVAFLTLLALLSSWINWGFSLIFSAMLARAMGRELLRRGVAVDYRALCAASFLGLGSIWAQGLSGSAALQMATPGLLPESIARIVEHGGLVPRGVIPLSSTIFLWQSLLSVAVEVVLVTLVMWWAAPEGERAVTAAALGVTLDEDADPTQRPPLPLRPDAPGPAARSGLEAVSTAGRTKDEDQREGGLLSDERALPPPRTPGERLERSPLLSLVFLLCGALYLGRTFLVAQRPLEAINLNTVNLSFLLLGVALHRTPARFLRAFAAATPAVWGVILQFPFYGGISGVISETALNERLARAFVAVSTPQTFPPLMALYSALLGIFVPSGGAKWVIEAPYVMGAAHQLRVHLGWMVAVYDLGEALANLVQPFWMLPVLALLGLRARDVMGYTFLIFLLLTPVVVLLTYLLGLTLHYPL